MKINFNQPLPRAVAALALAALAWTPAALAEPDVPQRPALASARAAGSVLLSIAAAGTRIVAAGERGIIVYSDDAGASWRQATVPVSVSLTSLRFANQHEGWAAGHGGVVLHTRDGGKTWTRQLDGNEAARLLLAAVQGGQGGALADAQRLVSEGPSKPFLDIHFFDNKNGMLAGAFGLLMATSDGGAHWQAVPGRLANPNGKHLYAIESLGSECYIAGEQGALFYSSDRGQSFTALDTPYEGTWFGALAIAPRSALLFGMRGNAWYSSDAGASWHKSEIATTASISAGLRLAEGALILADDTGQVWRSDDAGRRFRKIPASPASPLTGVVRSGQGDLLFSGVRGVTRMAYQGGQP